MSLTYNASYYRNTDSKPSATSVVVSAQDVAFNIKTVENDILTCVQKYNHITPVEYERQDLTCGPITNDAGKSYEGIATVNVNLLALEGDFKNLLIHDLGIVVSSDDEFAMILDTAITQLYKSVDITKLFITNITFKF